LEGRKKGEKGEGKEGAETPTFFSAVLNERESGGENMSGNGIGKRKNKKRKGFCAVSSSILIQRTATQKGTTKTKRGKRGGRPNPIDVTL